VRGLQKGPHLGQPSGEMEFDDLVGTTSPLFTLLWLLFSGSDHAVEASQKPEEVVPLGSRVVEGDEGGEDEEEDVTWEEEEEEEWNLICLSAEELFGSVQSSDRTRLVPRVVEEDEGGETDEEDDVTWEEEEEEEEEWKELVPGYDKESSKAFAPCPLFLRRQRTTGL